MARNSGVRRVDPLNIDGRVYKQVSELLDQLAEPNVTLRERTMALKAIASIRIAYVKLSDSQENPDAGASVRKYSAAFAQNAAGRRAKVARSRSPAAANDISDIAELTGPEDDED